MLSIDEYKEYVREHVLDFLPDEYSNAKLDFSVAYKNNDIKKEALMINDGSKMIPIIYIDEYYKEYVNGSSIDNTLSNMTTMYLKSRNTKNFNIIEEGFFNFENLKDRIVPVLCNAKKNADRLSNMPHEFFADDLAITYKIIIDKDKDGIATTHITNKHMEILGINYDTLKATAEANCEKYYKPTFKSMNEVLKEMFMDMQDDMPPELAEEAFNEAMKRMNMEDAIQLYVLSSEHKMDGSVCITIPEIQEKISEKLEGDFLIIPSSIHELIVFSLDGKMSSREINEMIHKVNESCLEDMDYLSDHVYKYDSKEKRVLEWNNKEKIIDNIENINFNNRGKSI